MMSNSYGHDCDVLVVGEVPPDRPPPRFSPEGLPGRPAGEGPPSPVPHRGIAAPSQPSVAANLGVLEEVGRVGMLKYGAEFVSPYHGKAITFEFANAWDKHLPYAFQVRRSEFDHILIRNAAAKGATVVEGCRVTEVEFPAEGGAVVTAKEEAAVCGGCAADSWSMRPAATLCWHPISASSTGTASTTVPPCSDTSPARTGYPARPRAISPCSGSITAGSGSFRWRTGRPASARFAGPIT